MTDPARQSPGLVRTTLRTIGSTWLGVGLMGAIALYLSVASTVPVRMARLLAIGVFSPSDPVEIYRYGPFVALCIALCVNLVAATVGRIRLRWHNAGAWCSHAGLIVLAAGSLWYAGASVSGDSVTVRMRGGWSPIRHVYRNRALSLYVRDANSQAVQVPLAGVHPRHEARGLDRRLDWGDPNVEIRAIDFLPSACVVETWRDISPNRIPAVRLRVTDGKQSGVIVLSPSLPEHRQFGGRGYAMIYHDGIGPAALAKVIAPADPNRGPGMPHELAMLLTGPQIAPTLAVVRPNGTRWHAKLEVGKPVDVPLAGRRVRVEPLEFLRHAARTYELAGAGDEAGHAHAHGAEPQGGVLVVEVRTGTWRRRTCLRFAAYEHLDVPQLIDLPGNRAIWLNFSREQLPLSATLEVKSAEYLTYGGSGIPKDYRCEVEVVSGGQRRRETLSLNHPVAVGAYQFSQGSWAADPHRPTRIFLIAASRPGLWVVWTGCVMICLGMPIAFYVKPLLLRRRRARP